MLFGDSHAAHWLPAFHIIGRRYGLKVYLSYWNSCHPAGLLIGKQEVRECARERKEAIQHIQKERPLFVFVSHRNYRSIPENQVIQAAFDGLFSSIINYTQPVLFTGVPYCGINPTYCLAKNMHSVNACGCSRPQAIKKKWVDADRKAARRWNIPFIDPTDLFCTEEFCPPIVKNFRVTSDGDHLTVAFSTYLSPYLEELLGPTIVDTVKNGAAPVKVIGSNYTK